MAGYESAEPEVAGVRVPNVKADVLAHFVPGFTPGDFVTTIEESAWPE